MTKLEEHVKSKGGKLWLGHQRQYDRAIGKLWSTVIRYLGFLSMSKTWRKGAVQGLEVTKFEKRVPEGDGVNRTISFHKGRKDGPCAVFLPGNLLPLWICYYNLRKSCCKADDDWDKENFFINISGRAFTLFDEDVNADLKDSLKSKVTGKKIRTLVETLGCGLTGDLQDRIHDYEHHSKATASRQYPMKSGDRVRQGHDAVQEALLISLVRENIIPQLSTYFHYHQKKR